MQCWKIARGALQCSLLAIAAASDDRGRASRPWQLQPHRAASDGAPGSAAGRDAALRRSARCWRGAAAGAGPAGQCRLGADPWILPQGPGRAGLRGGREAHQQQRPAAQALGRVALRQARHLWVGQGCAGRGVRPGGQPAAVQRHRRRRVPSRPLAIFSRIPTLLPDPRPFPPSPTPCLQRWAAPSTWRRWLRLWTAGATCCWRWTAACQRSCASWRRSWEWTWTPREWAERGERGQGAAGVHAVLGCCMPTFAARRPSAPPAALLSCHHAAAATP